MQQELLQIVEGYVSTVFDVQLPCIVRLGFAMKAPVLLAKMVSWMVTKLMLTAEEESARSVVVSKRNVLLTKIVTPAIVVELALRASA